MKKDKKTLIEIIRNCNKSILLAHSMMLIEKKKALGQSLVISKDGEIKVIKP